MNANTLDELFLEFKLDPSSEKCSYVDFPINDIIDIAKAYLLEHFPRIRTPDNVELCRLGISVGWDKNNSSGFPTNELYFDGKSIKYREKSIVLILRPSKEEPTIPKVSPEALEEWLYSLPSLRADPDPFYGLIIGC